MGQDTIDKAALVAGLEERDSKTKNLRIHGWLKNSDRKDPLHIYGSDIIPIKRMIEKHSKLGEKLHKDLFYVKAEVVWAVRKEMARKLEDVLARRTRALLLNARASIEMAPEVARIMAKELKYDKDWEDREVEEYTKLAKEYILD
jgi:glycerol-3-phosphate dehydrogenase